MKKITNTSLQGIFLTFFDGGEKTYFIKPKTNIVVPNSHTSIVLDNLVKRRILKVQMIQDESVVNTPEKLSKKSK